MQKAVAAKKVAYRRMLEVETEESRQSYIEAKREAKKVVRRAKNEEWIDVGRELEADAQGRQKRFWSRLRSLGGSYRGRDELLRRVKDEEGMIIGDEEMVVDRWKRYFAGPYVGAREELESRQARECLGEGIKEIELEEMVRERVVARWKRYFAGLYVGAKEELESRQARECLGEGIEEIKLEEMVRELSKMKNGKSPGVCNIQVELLKAGGMNLVKWMQRVFNMVMKSGRAPNDWRRAVVISVYKKGCRLTCSNYRGVSLLSVAGKWFGKVLKFKLRDCTEGRVLEEQARFRAKRSCVDQVFTLRQVMEKAIEKRRELLVAFIDLEKAYDRVNRVKLCEALRQAQVGEGLVRTVQSLYMECEARVKVGEKQSEWFNVDQGVRQGCTLSPWLFTVFLDAIAKEAREGFVEGVRMGNEIVDFLLFADDMVLVADSVDSLQMNLRKLDESLTRWKMKMNWENTEVMKVGKERGHS